MPERTIDQLPVKDYSEKPRQVHSYPGEITAIRRVDPNDSQDMKRYRELDRLLTEHGEFIGKELSDRSLRDQARAYQPGKTSQRSTVTTFAIAGLEESAGQGEIGEFQGYINFYPNEDTEVLKEHGILKDTDNLTVLDVSYGLISQAPKEQMASALRQACLKIARSGGIREAESDTSKDGTDSKPNTTILEYIDIASKDKEESKEILQAAGFEYRGEVDFDPETADSESIYEVYVLNWETLNTTIHQKSDAYDLLRKAAATNKLRILK